MHTKKILFFLALISMAVILLLGCGGQTYQIDYHGQKNAFQGAKDSYAAGAKVTLKYDLIATDTDYTFYVDGDVFNAEWSGNAYVIQFTMPDHNTEVWCEHHNSMYYMEEEPVPEENTDPDDFAIGEKNADGYRSISMEKAKAFFETKGEYVILDVRRADEFAEGHIPGAVNVANESITTVQPEELPDPEQLIFVYCRSGRRSKEAAAKLAAMGYENIVECGGILDWTGTVVKD